MLYRISGRAGSGKTTYCEEIISRCIEQKKRVFLIVPEQQAVLAEREIIRKLGNVSNLYCEVINFKRLCNRVFREAGGLVYGRIDSAAKKLILAKTLDTIGTALTEYGASAERSEFIDKAYSAIGEFTACGIAPDALERAAKKLANNIENNRFVKKLNDLALIYSSYRAVLREDFGDKGDLLDELYDTLRSYRFFDGCTVVIDSFYGFTAQELRILGEIMHQAEDTYITFLCGKAEDNSLFSRTEAAKSAIEQLAKERNIPFTDIHLDENKKFREGTRLKRLERDFSLAKLAPKPDEPNAEPHTEDVRIIRCDTAYDEAKCASALISHFVREGVRYRNIALAMRDPSQYIGILDVVLEKGGIPYYLSHREELMTNPLVSFVFAAFDLCGSYYLPHILRYLKTGLTGLSDEEADLLENYAVTWGITGARWKQDTWHMNPDGYSGELTERGRYILEVVNRAKDKLTASLESFTEDVKDAKSARELSTAVYHLLEETKAEHAEVALGDNAVFWNLLLDALDRMVFVYGDDSIPPTKYAELFRLVIDEFDTGRIPGSLDEVQIASAELMRTDGVTHVILLGINDGVFPAEIKEDVLFSDREKRLLQECGITLSPDSVARMYDELFLAYTTLCAASESAILLYAAKDLSGGEKRPSVLIPLMKNILPDLQEDCFPFQELSETLSGKNSLPERAVTEPNREKKEAFMRFLESDDTLAFYLAKLNQSDAPTDFLSEDTLHLITKKSMFTSSSRLETFHKCPFSYFGSYILNVKVLRPAELGAVETGNIAHKILELFLHHVKMRKDKDGTLFTAEEAALEIKSILAETIDTVTGDAKTASGRFTYLYSRLSVMLLTLAKSLMEELSQSEFFPSDFELEISPTAPNGVPPHPIPIEHNGTISGEVNIIGKIDRVDTFTKDGKTYVRVVDYKTGPKKFNMEDTVYGINLQMLLYLFQLWKNGKDHFGGGEVVPVGVLYLPCRRPDEAIVLGDDEAQTLNDLSGSFVTNGIVIDDMQILKAMERDLQKKYIPVKQNKDGSLGAVSSAIPFEELTKLLEKAAHVAAKLSGDLSKGNIKVNPYQCKELNSCAYCDLLPMCGFEKGKSAARYRLEPIL